MKRLWWIDTRWACGGIYVQNGLVLGGAPIFGRLVGQQLAEVLRRGQYVAIEIVEMSVQPVSGFVPEKEVQ